MSFDILREFDTLYAQKPPQTSTSHSTPNFSFLESLGTPQPLRTPTSSTSASSAFGDGVFFPQRPSSVQLSTQSAYRGIPQPMTRNKSNPLLADNGAGSSFNDLVGLLDSPKHVPTPVNSAMQVSTGRPASFHGMNRWNPSAGKDPFATLVGSSGLKNSSATTPSKSHSAFNWGSFNGSSKSTSKLPPQDAEDDFGDFASATNTPIPALPSRALQDSGTGFRRSLSVSTHVPTTPNYSAFSSAIPTPAKNTSKDNLSSLSLLETVIDFTHPISQQNKTANDDDFGEFIASPITSQFPTSTPLKPPLASRTTTTTTKTIPLSTTLPLPTPSTTTYTQPTLPPLSAILVPFSTTFTHPTTHLFSKLTQLSKLPQHYPLRQRILSHPKTRDFLLGTCEIARVAGRIIAGRKSRRNLNKYETQKVDREVAELVRIWKEELSGRLKAAMVTPRGSNSTTIHTHGYSNSDPTLSSSSPNVSRVPELEIDLKAERVPLPMNLILDKEETACFLCGLHQDEVVGKLHEHEFGRGERWWVAGSGHRGCLRWWEKWDGEVRKVAGAATGGKRGSKEAKF